MTVNEEKIEVRRHRISHLEMYEVTSDELERLQYEEPQRGYELAFAFTALSAALAILLPLVIGEPPKISSLRFAIFVALIVVGFVFFLFFGGRWFKNLKQRNLLFGRIKARQIGPVREKEQRYEQTNSLSFLRRMPAARSYKNDSDSHHTI